MSSSENLVQPEPSLTNSRDFCEDDDSIAGESISTNLLGHITLAGHLGEGENEALPFKKDKQWEGWKRYKGILFTIYAICMTSLGAAVLKSLSHVHPLTIAVYSFPIGTFTSVPFLWYRYYVDKKPMLDNLLPLYQHKRTIFFMWLRSTCTLMLNLAIAWLAKYVEVSDSRTIMVTFTPTINLVAWIWFHEKFGIIKAAASVLTICGVAIMTKTPFLLGGDSKTDEPISNINTVAFCAMVFISINMLVLRHLHHIYHGVRNTYLFTWAFIWTLPFAIGHEKMIIPNCSNWDIAGIAGYGILLSLNNTFFAWALKDEEAGIVALARSSEFVLNTCWNMILFSKFPDGISLGGMFLALTGLLTALLRTWVKGKEEGSVAKRYVGWVLL